MLTEPYYFRNPSFLYPLQSHPSYWFHVGKSDTSQVIIGLLGMRMQAMTFSNVG